MQEMQVQSLGWDGLLEKEMATHSSILACEIPRIEEPGRQQSTGWHGVKHDMATKQLSPPHRKTEQSAYLSGLSSDCKGKWGGVSMLGSLNGELMFNQ